MARCGNCKEPTTNRYGLTAACNPEHAIAIARAKQAKKDAKQLREDKARIKTRQQWLKEAQAAFNAWIRERDHNEPCISCNRFHTGSYDAGHYRNVGSNPALRFEPLNCWKQCVPCNQHRSGNSIEYRIHLVRRIGVERVEWLEGPHEPKKYDIPELHAIKAKYTKMRRELEKERL